MRTIYNFTSVLRGMKMVSRQVLQEFAPELEVILVNCDGETLELTQKDLLPYSFGSENLSAE